MHNNATLNDRLMQKQILTVGLHLLAILARH